MFKVYSSSAGSGKTYTLTKEYLKLALHTSDPLYFKHILAVTFTNAAAKEMKSRILTTLGVFSKIEMSDVELPQMFQSIVNELYPQTRNDKALFADVCLLISGRAKFLFHKILHRYSDFSVMTIDKFTKRLVSSFTDELGLPFVFETQIDADLLKDAVDRLLARIGQENEEILSEIVESYYMEKAEEGSSWGALPEAIRKSSEILLNEEAYLKMKNIAALTMTDWTVIRKQIRNFRKEKENEIIRLAKMAMQDIENNNLIDKDFFQGARGIYTFFFTKSESYKLWDAPNSYCVKTVDEDKWYGSKPSNFTRASIDEIKANLANYFTEIVEIRDVHFSKVQLYQAIEKHVYHLSLLGEIRKEFNDLLKEHNQVHISDFNRRIAEIVSNEPIPFIFERMGERYNHILLDEFQDTSKLQFANLLPLIENALGENYFNLVVGDAKQSIYRFRGGDMDLILHLSQDEVMGLSDKLVNNKLLQERLRTISSHMEVDHLRTNRRSYKEITQFNNEFFAYVASSLAEEYPLVEKVYDDYFKQEIQEDVSVGGHVQVDFCDNSSNNITDEQESDVDQEDAILNKTLELVASIHNQGYNWSDIAILSRNKKNAANIANALRTQGIPLISDDALTLAHSKSLAFIIAILKVVQNTNDNLARYEAMYLYHLEVRKVNPDPTDFLRMKQISEQPGLDSFLGYFASWNIILTAFKLRQLSLFELTENLIRVFGLNINSSENEYIFRFLDVILEFSNKKGNYLGDFLDHWETARFKISIVVPDDTDTLRITTIHKSKGLEYPVVIIPYANWIATPSKADQLWVDIDEDYDELKISDVEPLRVLSTSLVSVKKELENSVIAEQYQDHVMRTIVENLNLLYVAFTRPIQALYIITNKPKSRVSGISVRNWLFEFINRNDSVVKYSEEQSCYILNQGISKPTHSHKNISSEIYKISKILSTDPGKKLRLRRQAERIFDIETFEIKNDTYQKVCYLLTRLKSCNDLSKMLMRISSEGIINFVDETKIKLLVNNLLLHPDIAPLYNENLAIDINKEILIPGGKVFHVDRVVQLPDEGFVLMRFVALDKITEPLKQMKKMVQAYSASGIATKGLIVVIENQSVTWVT